MIGVVEVKALIQVPSLVREVSLLKRGHVRMETAFLYPDGTSIEVFVRKSDLFPKLQLTDLGQTHAWLLDLQVKPWLSKKRREFLDDALRTYGVELSGGELTLHLNDAGSLMDGVIRLAQACLRVADLAYTRRASLQTSFAEEIEEVVGDIELPYETNADVEGKYGKVVRVDLRVTGPRVPSLVLGWSSGNAGQAHVIQNEIFRKWTDLDKRSEQRITIIDDKFDVYRADDLKRIGDVSLLVALADRPTLQAVLGA